MGRGPFVIVVLASLLAAGPAAGDPLVPELVVEAPPELAAEAERLRRVDPGRLAAVVRLVGARRPGPPIRVLLAPEGSAAARSAPPWISGYAYGNLGLVVLLPARSPTYPDDDLAGVLAHEVAHVLIARAAAGRPVPRWFNEGLAMIAGGSWGLEDRAQLTWAMVRGPRVPLGRLDARFAGGPAATRRAYALSGAFVRDLVERHGPRVAGEVLGGLALGLPFEEAFRRATGETLAAAEAAFWRRQTFWHRWVPVLTSSATLWIGITLLALWAIKRRRERDAALQEAWEAEERWLEDRSADGPVH